VSKHLSSDTKSGKALDCPSFTHATTAGSLTTQGSCMLTCMTNVKQKPVIEFVNRRPTPTRHDSKEHARLVEIVRTIRFDGAERARKPGR
jgi:hypothetical protein